MSDASSKAKKPKVVTTFRISGSNKARLQQLAKQDDRTVSNLVNRAVREFLERRSIN